jgi:hypothetical protein
LDKVGKVGLALEAPPHHRTTHCTQCPTVLLWGLEMVRFRGALIHWLNSCVLSLSMPLTAHAASLCPSTFLCSVLDKSYSLPSRYQIGEATWTLQGSRLFPSCLPSDELPAIRPPAARRPGVGEVSVCLSLHFCRHRRAARPSSPFAGFPQLLFFFFFFFFALSITIASSTHTYTPIPLPA